MNDEIKKEEKTMVDVEKELSTKLYKIADQMATDNNMTVAQVIGVLESLKQSIFDLMR